MRAHQFYRKVWRVNALVILLVGILGVGVLVITAFFALSAMFRERQVAAVVPPDDQQQVQEELSLGQATHNRFLIVNASQLPGSEYAEPENPTAAVAFEVVQADTDGDKRLTGSDLSSLVLTKPDGTQIKTVLDNVRRIVSQEMIGDDVVILYEGASGYGKAVISSTDFSRTVDEPLELPEAAGS